MNSTAKEGLECPLQNHKVSFRLVDEHGDGRPFAGLRYLLHDRHDQTLEGNLDGEGFALIASTHCAPLVLDLSDKLSRYADPWYEEGCAGPGFRLACAGRQPRGRAPGGSRRRAETGLRLTPERASKPGRTTTVIEAGAASSAPPRFLLLILVPAGACDRSCRWPFSAGRRAA